MARRRLISLLLPGLAVVGLAVAAAGCGGSGSPNAASTTTTATTTTSTTTTTTTGARGGTAFAAAFQAYQSCLKSKGVTVPQFNGRRPGTGTTPRTPTGTSTNPTSTTRRPGGGFRGGFGANLTAKQRAALTACRSKLPAGSGFGRPGGFGGGAGGARPGGGAPNTGGFAKYTACLTKHGVKFGAANQSQAAFQKAQTACRSLLTTPSTTTTTASG